MNKSFATFGILAVTGVLSQCDLCGSSTRAATRAAVAAPPAFVAPVSAALQTQTTRRIPTLPSTVMLCGPGDELRRRHRRNPHRAHPPARVTTADVSYRDNQGSAVVTYDSARVSVAQMVSALRMLGCTAMRLQ